MQFIAVGLGMLPLYWLVWRQPLDPKYATARAVITAMRCFVVWYGFLAGHVLNNVVPAVIFLDRWYPRAGLAGRPRASNESDTVGQYFLPTVSEGCTADERTHSSRARVACRAAGFCEDRRVGLADARQQDGPAMPWFGWLGTAFLGASAISLLALPLTRRWPPPGASPSKKS